MTKSGYGSIPHKLYTETKQLFDELKGATKELEISTFPPQLEALRAEVNDRRAALNQAHADRRIAFKKHVAELRRAFEAELDAEQQTLNKEIILQRQNTRKTIRPAKVIKQHIKSLEKQIKQKLKVVRSWEFNSYEALETACRDFKKDPHHPDEISHPLEIVDLYKTDL